MNIKINKNTSMPVKCITTGIQYHSISQAARQTRIERSNIGKVCNNKLKTAGKCLWEYIK